MTTNELRYTVAVHAEHSPLAGSLAWTGEPPERLEQKHAGEDPRESNDYHVFEGTARELIEDALLLRRRGTRYGWRAAAEIVEEISPSILGVFDALRDARPSTGWTPDAMRAAAASVEGVTLGETQRGEALVWAPVMWHGLHVGTAWFHGESDDDDELGFDQQLLTPDRGGE